MASLNIRKLQPLLKIYLPLCIIAGVFHFLFALRTGLQQAIASDSDLEQYLVSALSNIPLLLDLLQFSLGLVILYSLWAVALTFCSSPVSRLFSSSASQMIWHTTLFGFSLFTIGALNSYLYPLSSSAVFRHTIVDTALILAVCVLVFVVLALWHILILIQRREYGIPVCLLLIGTLSFVNTTAPIGMNSAVAEQTEQPNIVLVGIDGLRPDHLSTEGFSPSVTPNLDEFLSRSVVYGDAYSPIARTFATWQSLLTGQYPLENGVRFNLTDKSSVNRSENIPTVLRQKGYKTIYAMDERRFNNVDEDYGFDRVIGPRIGAADFVLSPVSDQPLLNLISHTSLGKYLFPFIYINRGQHKTYDPSRFVREVETAVPNDTGQPVFLAVHLTLPHAPYVNAFMPEIEGHKDALESNVHYYLYLHMLKQVDEQFGELMAALERQNILNNAQLYVFSDHGESFNLATDSLRGGDPTASMKTDSLGHGSHVLSEAQYRVLMAYRGYGSQQIPAGQKKYLSSLLDIPATIVATAISDYPYEISGNNLWSDNPRTDYLFLENAFKTASMDGSRLDAAKIAQEGISYYRVNDDGLLVLAPEKATSVIAAKQRAVVHDRWLLALMPTVMDTLILVDRETGTWWPTLTINPSSTEAPIAAMRSQLCAFYRDDPGFDPFDLCQRAIFQATPDIMKTNFATSG